MGLIAKGVIVKEGHAIYSAAICRGRAIARMERRDKRFIPCVI